MKDGWDLNRPGERQKRAFQAEGNRIGLNGLQKFVGSTCILETWPGGILGSREHTGEEYKDF